MTVDPALIRQLTEQGDTPVPLFEVNALEQPPPVDLPPAKWAACLAWLVDRFVQAVHTRQDPAEIEWMWQQASTLTRLNGRDPALSAAVLLAACVSPDRSVEAQARWLSEQAWDADEDAERNHREAAS